jgi:mannose-1-phosphate guanylyltransferase
MMLAAGRGERLLPLTHRRAKPSLPVLGETLMERAAAFLYRHGIRRFAFNTHHCPESVEEAIQPFRSAHADTRWHVFHETALAGTGGGLKGVKDFFKDDASFLLINADCLCDFDMAPAMKAFESEGAQVMMVCVPQRPHQTPVWLDAGSKVLAFGGERPAGAQRAVTFAGVHFLRQGIWSLMPDKPAFDMVSELYRRMLADGMLIRAFVMEEGFWEDFGTPERFLSGTLEFAAFKEAPMPWAAETARLGPSSRCAGMIIVEKEAVVEDGAELRDVLVMPGARIAAGARLERCLVGPGEEMAPGAMLKNTMYCEGRAHAFRCGEVGMGRI